MRRREFLQEFLGSLGAIDIRWLEETDEKISGIVIYEPDDPEEIQEFIWHKSETSVPNKDILNLVKLIHTQKLLSIDQIKVTRAELQAEYNSKYGMKTTEQEFSNILEALKSVEVPMVDEGHETDVYFIHE